LETLKASAEMLKGNKIRSSLTMLGIVIGIAATVGAVSMGEGMKLQLARDLTSFGHSAIFVYRERDPATGRWPPMLDLEDARLISRIQGIKKIAPSRWGNANIRYGTKRWQSSMEGVTPEYGEVRNRSLESGRFITYYDVREGAKVCVITDGIEEELFPDGNYLGKKIEINGRIFEVVGKARSFKLQSVFGQPLNSRENHVFIPITAAMEMSRSEDIDSIFLEYSPDLQWDIYSTPARIMRRAAAFFSPSFDDETPEVNEIKSRIERLLLLRKGARYPYVVSTLNDYVRDIRRTLWVATVVLGSIAVLSLLVGGIGIMNIMIISVTERTREIGIRKAVGARRGDILRQFLTETLFLSLAGGVSGIAVGFLASRTTAALSDIPIAVPWWSALLGFAFASLVGIASGLYPAYRAATLDPIEALRYE